MTVSSSMRLRPLGIQKITMEEQNAIRGERDSATLGCRSVELAWTRAAVA